MKIYNYSSIVVALLLASSTQEINAIRIQCPGDTCGSAKVMGEDKTASTMPIIQLPAPPAPAPTPAPAPVTCPDKKDKKSSKAKD